MAEVSIRNVRKSYGSIDVIHGVDIDIHNGEFVILVGPSGCGKSTLLRMIAGLEEITAGEISIDGRIVNEERPKNRDLAMVFQNYALYPHMSVAANMAFSLKMKGVSRAEQKRKILAVAEILGLEKLLDRKPRHLSGGQRQRVAMGRAIIRDPKVFLFDEPLSNLDSKLRVQMRAEIRSLHHRLGTTIIYVTHDQIEAMTMADKIVVMNDGRVEQIGSPLELYDKPDNLFVAGFIGSPAMNFLSGRITGEDGNQIFKTPEGFRLSLPSLGTETVGREVILGFRPEGLLLVPDGAMAQVLVVEPTGPETHVLMSLDGAEIVGIFRERLLHRPGEALNVSVDPAAAHIFDKGTGKRIAMHGSTVDRQPVSVT